MGEAKNEHMVRKFRYVNRFQWGQFLRRIPSSGSAGIKHKISKTPFNTQSQILHWNFDSIAILGHWYLLIKLHDLEQVS